MDELFTLHPDGAFSRGEALEFGYDDRAIRNACRSNVIVRIRHGAYAAAERWAGANPEARHLMRCMAAIRTHKDDSVALCHVSSSVDHGLPLFRPQLDKIHLLRLDGGPGRNLGDICYHSGAWSDADLERTDGRVRTVLARAAAETATMGSLEQGVVALNSALHMDSDCEDALRAQIGRMLGWPSGRKLQICGRLMRQGAESVGESRTWFLCWRERLPEPVLQFEVYDEWGQLVAVLDFAWPEHKVFGEFDGRIKYGRLIKEGDDISEVVFREKQREDRVREITDWSGVRITWIDLDRGRQTGNRIRSKLDRGRARAA